MSTPETIGADLRARYTVLAGLWRYLCAPEDFVTKLERKAQRNDCGYQTPLTIAELEELGRAMVNLIGRIRVERDR